MAPEFFRYRLDAASMDFGAVTDHSAGGDVEYWWWLIQKLTEMHQVPGRYLALFGNERSATYPNGHRNIIHPYLGLKRCPSRSATTVRWLERATVTCASLRRTDRLPGARLFG
jgi:hypothetical protein